MPSTADEFRAQLAQGWAELQSGRPQSAELLYRQALARDPDHPEATHFLGLSLTRMGRVEEGLTLMRRSLALNAADPNYPQNLAFVLAQQKRLAEAESCLREAIAINPGIASLYNYLGIVLQQQGAPQAALRQYREALALGGGDEAVHNNFGYALLECGHVDAAIEQLRASLRLNELSFMAYNNLGNALRAKGDLDAAVASFRRAIELAPDFTHAHHNLGILLREEGKIEEAVACFRTAAKRAPAETGLWQAFAVTVASLRFGAPDREMEEDLATCLEREDVDPDSVAFPALSLLRTDPAFDLLVRGTGSRNPEWLAPSALAALRRSLFRLLLENAIVPDPEFEALVENLRRALLFSLDSGRLEANEENLELACALAQQCFLKEYALEEAADESAVLEGIAKEISTCGGRPGLRQQLLLAMYAVYRPLDRAPVAQAPELIAARGAFARLVRRQVVEPGEERRIRAEIPALTTVENAVSRAVQDQYEQNPYPRWLRAASFFGAFPLGTRLRMLAPHVAAEEISLSDRPDILISGCGTGRHAAIVARLHPAARVLAVDLSGASLAFALRRCRELGIWNVRFARADLLRLGRLEERFDVIECVGVLHHLEDPRAGWEALLGLLRPGGFMKIALYSELGRRAVVAAKRLIAERGFAATAEGVRAARRAIMSLPEGSPARNVLVWPDFYSLSGCRDLLFHAKEHRFTLEGIQAALPDLGLEFLGFEFDTPVTLRRYREFSGGAAATSLRNWAEFEAQYPETFASMYQFWVRRKNAECA